MLNSILGQIDINTLQFIITTLTLATGGAFLFFKLGYWFSPLPVAGILGLSLFIQGEVNNFLLVCPNEWMMPEAVSTVPYIFLVFSLGMLFYSRRVYKAGSPHQ